MFIIGCHCRLQEELGDIHQDRLVLVGIRSNKNHVLRQPQKLQSVLLPLRTAWQGEQEIRTALTEMIEENLKWIQLYEVGIFFYPFSPVLIVLWLL